MNIDRLATAILLGLVFALALALARPAAAFQKGTLEFDYCVQLHMEHVLWQTMMPSPSRELWESRTHMNMEQHLIQLFQPGIINQCSMEERYAMADVPRDLWPSAIKP